MDSVRVVFTADISDLRRGLDAAASGIAETTAVLRRGSEQLGLDYVGLTRSYAAGAAQRLDLVRRGSDEELAAARAGDRAQTEIGLNGLRLQGNAVREAAQLAQVSHEEERASLLALEDERVAIERRHLVFLQGTYRDDARAYAEAQRQIDVLASQSALRRQEIERAYLREIDADYRRAFEQVGSAVSGQVMGMIRGHETLRQAVGNVALSIVQSFIQARVRTVADWLAGQAAQVTATAAGEGSKTAAVAAGTAARTGLETNAAAASGAATIAAVLKSILASAAETFAGIFGFLAPVMGPAAAGPAVAGEATVAAAAASLPSFAAGSWSLPADMVARVHAGEMIVPSGPAAVLRAAAGAPAGGQGGARAGGGDVHAHFHVSAMDGRDVRRFFSDNARHILGAINDGVRSGSHLGLSKLRSPAGV